MTLLLAGLFVLTAVNLFIFQKNFNYLFSSNVFSVLFTLFLIWLLYSGQANNQGIIFYALYPAFIILLLGKKRGNMSSLVFFVLSGIAIILPVIFSFGLEFSLLNQILFVLLFFVCFILLNIYEKIQELQRTDMQIEIQKAKHETQVKEEFISKISHQIRTPLNNLVVVTNIVNDSNLDEKQKDLIDTIQASTNNLVNVVNK